MAHLVVLADLHINTTKYPAFENTRIEKLIDAIKSTEATGIIFAGDTFDRNTPTLRDIKLFYYLIGSLPDYTIEIINGNHDPDTFNYLPHAGFTYYSEITKRDNITFVPWTKLHDLKDADQHGICISHARCTIEPHIVEEYRIETFSEMFGVTVLGDIHSPISPYHNVHYCSSVSSTHFKKYKVRQHGFIVLDTETLEIERVWINSPSKVKITSTMEQLSYSLSLCKSHDSLYKVVVEDYAEKLKGINRNPRVNTTVEPLVKVNETKVSSTVAELFFNTLTVITMRTTLRWQELSEIRLRKSDVLRK